MKMGMGRARALFVGICPVANVRLGDILRVGWRTMKQFGERLSWRLHWCNETSGGRARALLERWLGAG